MPDLTDDEMLALNAVGAWGEGHRSLDNLRAAFVERLRPAVDSLAAKGMIEPVWVVSEAGLKTLAEKRADDYLAGLAGKIE